MFEHVKYLNYDNEIVKINYFKNVNYRNVRKNNEFT